nr:MAG TPA: hypothetical protein [Caudoviricetes sp.]
MIDKDPGAVKISTRGFCGKRRGASCANFRIQTGY